MRAGMIASTAAISLLAACTTSAPELPPPPSIGGQGPGVSAETSESAESAMPEVITEDLAREILTELEARVAVFFRWLIDSEVGVQPPASIRASLEAAYLPELVEPLVERFVDEHERLGGEHPNVVRPFGQYVPEELAVLRSDPACPLLRVTWDATTTERREVGNPRQEQVVALVLSDAKDGDSWVYNSIFDVTDITPEDVDAELRERELCP